MGLVFKNLWVHGSNRPENNSHLAYLSRGNFGPILFDSGDLFCEFYFKLFESRLNLNILLRKLFLAFFKGRTHYYIVFIIAFKMKENNRSLLSDMSHLKIE